MRFPKDKKNAYINGYNKLSDQDYSIIYGGEPVKWSSDWEIDGKKKVDKETIASEITDIPTPGGATHFNMYSDVDNLFKYSKNIKNIFEDPTYLGFSIKIDTSSSPLFNYGGINKGASVGSFIQKYNIIPDIADRQEIYDEFVSRIFELFQSDFTNNQFVRSYYIQSISGLDKFNSKMVKYGEDKLSIILTEDISLRSTYLAELYNNLCYSYKDQRYMIPENLLRFDMIIEVTDIRIFRLYSDDAKKLGINNKSDSFINTDPPRIIYTLHDCNFDFFNSMPFEGAMTISGTEGTSNKPAVFTFDIKYKSISKEFRSNIIDKNVLTINNKLNDIVKKNNDLTGEKVNFFKNDIYSEEFQTEKIKKGLSSKVDKYVSNVRDKIVGKINEERGKLINKLIDSVRKPSKLSKIYPDNVYSSDFRKLSIENFAKNIGTDIANNLEDKARNALMGITKPPF